ncbi:MAG: MBL fold metallo-hydrolase [Candidatus Diapherotrites archaeon]|nr:MBL fold metallo-hydrolase [Candidatus Diapherotrites archaeon]
MKMTVLGSGGFQVTPRPCCNCKICKEAKQKGKPPYVRRGPALFIHGQNMLIDTPEDIIESLRYSGVNSIDKILYTHWHPDHTAGIRLVEQMNGNWRRSKSTGKHEFAGTSKTPIYAPSEIIHDIRNIVGPGGSYLSFYEKSGFIETREMGYFKDYTFGNFKVTPLPQPENSSTNVCTYLLEEGKKKVLYAPCDVKPWHDHKQIENLDMLIINSPWTEKISKGVKITGKHPLRDEVFSLEEIFGLIDKYNVKRTVITHIEEMWQLNPKDYKKLETKYKKYGIEFAYDGMTLSL